jgi:hypothetical protein
MALLKEAENQMAYFKCGMQGFPGSGKTFTSALIAIGICKKIGNNKVAFFDTETGSDFLIEKFRENGIKLFQIKSRAFNDLLETIEECLKEKIGVLIIDSITHVWRELTDSYEKKTGKKRLEFHDWKIIKEDWAEYTDLFVNSKLHIIVCGRAGYKYEYDVNEDGTKDLIKTGTKMKVEGEFNFEPSLVIEMVSLSEERDALNEILGKADFKSKSKKIAHQPKPGSRIINRAFVLKDRTTTINGMSFDMPTFEDILPHFEKLNIGGDHLGIDTSRNSENRFDFDGKPEWKKEHEKRVMAYEEIKGELEKVFTTTAIDKKAKLILVEHVFGTTSGTKIETMSSTSLEEGLRYIKAILAVKENTIENLAKGEIIEPDYKTSQENLPFR